jgi:hypothetical protein
MNASTSKSKLYGYLKGYEVTCFTGDPLSEVIDSVSQLICDELEVHFPDLNISTHDRLRTILSSISKFLTSFYRRMKDVKSASKVPLLCEKSKESLEILDSIVSQLVSTDMCHLDAMAILTNSNDPEDICLGKCPWYLSDRICLLFTYEELSADECIVLQKRFRISEYRFLGLSLLQLANFLCTTCGVAPSNLGDYYTLFTDITSIGHIFELMNYSGSERLEYMIDEKNILESSSVDTNSNEWAYWDSVLSEVFNDIEEGRLSYVRELSSALRRLESVFNSPYDCEQDYYYSQKGTGQSAYTKEHHSIVSSAFELDPHKYDERVKKFDEYVGYTSYYKELSSSEEAPEELVCVRIIAINNPSKPKPRIIHVADNPLQDRCNWIHRRLMNLLKLLECDCTYNQGKGREFLRSLTEDWYLQSDPDSKIGVYCTDFSSATDYLNQYFSHRVIEFLFHSSEVANFWDYVSTLPKKMIFPDNSSKWIHQINGQPQGMLGSFPMLAMCHYFIFLMDMKANDMTRYHARQYFRILGDDAVFNTIVPERFFLDECEDYFDEDGNKRSLLEINHFGVCSEYAGLKINYSKSLSAHSWDNEAKLDFAKVTYRNGHLFSPIPFRLAMHYCKSFDSKLATLIWRADRGEPKVQQLLDLIINNNIPEGKRDLYSNTIRSGIFPFLSNLAVDQEYPEDFVSIMTYSACVTMLTGSLAFTLTNDHERDLTDYDQYDRAMRTLFSPAQQMRLDKIDSNHKVMNLLCRNAEVIELLHTVYGETEFDDRFMSFCVSSLYRVELEDVYWFIYDLAKYAEKLRLMVNNPQAADENWIRESLPTISSYGNARSQIRKVADTLSLFCVTDGNTKSPRNGVFLFRKAFDFYESVQSQLLSQTESSIKPSTSEVVQLISAE